MQNKLITIMGGVILIVSMGFVVYATKKPPYIPVENNGGAVIDDVVNNENVKVPASSQSATQSTIKKPTTWFGSDDDDDDEDGVRTTTNTPVVTQPTPVVPATTPKTATGITLTQIAGHNSRSSCWSAVNGSVYDLTSWIPNHPGGENAILSICGVDGSNSYNRQHGGSSRPASILFGFKIGTLAK